MKPLSEKNILKMYLAASIKEEESKLLHHYFLCFSYLYGCIDIKELWDIFKHYDEKIGKQKFYDFADIVQRETNEYSVFSLSEAYSGETSTKTEDKLLINNTLLEYPRYRFWSVHQLNENMNFNNGPYIPSKEELFKFDHDLFYESEDGKAMASFISNLKTSGFESYKYNNETLQMHDLNGNSVEGQCLKDFAYITHSEMFDINYYKKDSEKLKKKYGVNSANKILSSIKFNMMVKNIDDFNMYLSHSIDEIAYNYGVKLSEDELKEYINLYMRLFNSANRWVNFGWSANELIKHMPSISGPIELQIGDNMQKMIKEGEIDLNELEDLCSQHDVRLSFKGDEDNDFEKIISDNNKYLKIFEKFLEKNGFQECGIDEHIDRVDCYINHFLMIGIAEPMEKGCSLDIINFIQDFVNEKVIPANVMNIDLFLNSICLFYKCMSEKGFISLKSYSQLVEDVKELKDEIVDDYYDKNPVHISIDTIIDLIDMAHGFGTAYINIKSGESVIIPDDEGLIDDDMDELYLKVEGHNWESLPEIKDYKIMIEFSENLKSIEQVNKLIDILHNKKAYRRFKDAIYDMGIEDQYFDYYHEEIYKIAISWMDENGINKDDYEEYDDYLDDDLDEEINIKH